jgi:hypothetical protein
VKRLVAGLAGIAGIAWFRRRKPQGPDPADELKAKLAEAREVADDRAEFEAGEKPVDEVPDAAARPEDPAASGDGGLDARRRDVHDRARAAIDDLSSDS